jgi:3-oxoacid CoA-transferase subunit B
MGGAMDLVAGVRRVVVVMEHVDKHNGAKILPACTLPLTGTRVVDRIITDRGCFDIDKLTSTVTLTELAPGETVHAIRAITGVPFVDGRSIRESGSVK